MGPQRLQAVGFGGKGVGALGRALFEKTASQT